MQTSNSPRSLPKNPRGCTIWDSWVFENFVLSDELLRKGFQSVETCLSVTNTLCGKLVSSLVSSITNDESFKLTLILRFIPDFNLISYKLVNFTFKLLYQVILCWFYIKMK